MWTRIVLLCSVICFATLHPVTEENETSRVPRQLDFEECCPCPHSKGESPGIRDHDKLADTTGERARFVDDCPCRPREADSYGSPSILFPSSMRAERPFMGSGDSKEDPKNLLQPEVGLANSVLETIRKATSEEYQEALMRDAARSAAKNYQDDSLLNDSTPEESGKNIVTIILSSKETDSFDEVMSEASRIKESRCIHSALGSYRSNNLSKMRMPTSQPTHLMKEIFKFPKTKHTGPLHRNLLDMDSYVGASNTQERVAMDNNRLRNNRPNLGLKFSNNLSKTSDIDNYGIRGRIYPEEISTNDDLDHAPTNKEVEFTDDIQNIKETPSYGLAPTENKFLQRPSILRNLLKLKDVELIPSKTADEKFKFTVPKHRLTPLINRKSFNADARVSNRKLSDLSTLLRNGLKFNLNNPKHTLFGDQEETLNTATPNTNVEMIPHFRDNIVDAIPSPSNIGKQFKNHKDCGNEIIERIVVNNTQMIGNNVIEDTQSSPSEDHPFLVQDDISTNAHESCDNDENNNYNPEEKKPTVIEDTQPSPPEDHPLLFQDDKITNVHESCDSDENNNFVSNSEEIKTTVMEDTQPTLPENYPFIVKDDKNIKAHENYDNDENNNYNPEETKPTVIENTQPSPPEDHPLLVQDNKSTNVHESCVCDENNNLVSNSEAIKPTEKIKSQNSNEIGSKVSAIREKETIDNVSNEPVIDSNECQEKFNAGQDSIAAANNDIQYVLPREEKEKEITSFSLEHEIVDAKETCNDDVNQNNIAINQDQIKPLALKIKPVPLKDTLTTLKEKVFKTLDSLKKTTMKPELAKDVRTYSQIQNNNEETEGNLSTDDTEVVQPHYAIKESDMEKAASTLISNKKTLEDSTEYSDAFTTRDLQELSDSILEASTKKDGTLGSKSEACDSVSQKIENMTEEVDEVYLDSGTSASSQNEVLSTDVNHKNTEENACITDLGSSNAIKKEETLESSSTLNKSKRTLEEMTAEASSSILDSVNPDPLGLFNANNNLRSIFLPDIIVQPSTILNDELNIFRQPLVDLGDILNLKTSLPTLDDIKLQLSSIFNANERDTSDEISYEVGYKRDRTNPEMATAASITNFQSKLPSLKRLEDVNLDIFQMNPITLAHSDLIPKIPRLNFNSYRTKLAIPKTVDLKPIKLQSAIGDKAGVFGATLTMVPDEFKIKPLFNSNIDTSRLLPDLLSNSLKSVPSLDELHDTMRSNVQSLINTPFEKTNGNILHNSLRPSLSLDIPDSIRAHADNKIKDIQRTMKVLKARPPSDLNNFVDTIKTPEDLVELASRTREDVSDKLKALHYDLNDRLTSIRESVIDESKLPSLNTPLLTRNDRKNNMSPNSNLIMRKKPSTSRTSHRTKLPGRRESQNKNANSLNKKIGEGKDKIYKMSPAASVPVPKSVEVPKLKSTTTKSVLSNVRSEANLKPNFKSFEPKQGVLNIERQPAKSPFGFTKSPLNNPGPFHKETKVTISFTTTPRPTSHSTKNTSEASPEFGLRKGAHYTSKLNTSLRNRANSLSNNNKDIKGSPSELWPSSKAASSLSDSFGSKTKTPTISDRTRTPLSRGSKSGPDMSTWPSVSDNTFLSKVREAVRARLANFKPVLTKVRPDTSHSNLEMDMARSPSEKVETVLEEPLKETVSYKCRMVCNKE